jgi:hypothetical protein
MYNNVLFLDVRCRGKVGDRVKVEVVSGILSQDTQGE